METYTTANGQRATITLADSSTAMLNVGTQLDVPADYAAGNHTVWLRGEALFTVSHHGGRAFTVVAGSTVTRVLGTSFVVRRYVSDTVTTVAVRDGKVSVGPTVVPAAWMAEVGSNRVARIRGMDRSLFGFAAGVLTLDSMSLSNAIPELDRWYNADVRLGDPSLAAQPVEGDVSAGSLGELANILELSLDVRVVRTGRVLTLYPRSS
jgi:transmembrane sensor